MSGGGAHLERRVGQRQRDTIVTAQLHVGQFFAAIRERPCQTLLLHTTALHILITVLHSTGTDRMKSDRETGSYKHLSKAWLPLVVFDRLYGNSIGNPDRK